MPIIKSAKKQLRQNKVKRARNFPVRSQLKTTYKKAMTLISEGNREEAEKFLPYAYKIIDTAAKKNLIHDKNADRKKSNIAKALNAMGKGEVKVEEKAPVEAPVEAPKVEAPAAEVVEEAKAE